jgi:uncharacterized OB-fold protein
MPDLLRLPILRCTACGTLDPGPRVLCEHCQSTSLVQETTPGVGRLMSWTIIRRPAARFRDIAPIGIAIVALDAGIAVTGRLARPEAPHEVGERVAAIALDDSVGIFEVAGA